MVSIPNKYLVYWLAMLFVLIPLGNISAAEIPIIDAHSQVDQYISLEEILSLMDDAPYHYGRFLCQEEALNH